MNSTPDYVNVNLDEPSRAYWIEITNPNQIEDEFMKIISTKEIMQNSLNIEIIKADNISNNSIVLHVLDNNYDYINLNYSFSSEQLNTIGITGELAEYINQISSGDCDNCFNQENNIFWIDINPGNTTIEIHFPSDVNEDETVDILDVVLIVNILVGGLPQSN